MKLRHKIFLSVGLAWIIFLSFSYIVASYQNLVSYLVIATSFTIFVSWIFYNFLFKRLELLHQELTEANASTSSKRLYDVGNDEIALFAATINAHLHSLEQAEKRLAANAHDNHATQKKIKDHTQTFSKFAHYDKIVSLPNRILFNEILNKSISHAKRHQKVMAVLIIDITTKEDHSHFTHTLSEYAIKELGERFVKVLRNEDVLAKLEGNEFIVLLSDIAKPKFASSVADKLLKTCATAINVDYKDLFLKASIGICVYPNDGQTLEHLVENAYTALNKARQVLANAYQFYSQELDVEAHEYIEFESDLKKSIENKELTLYYQPKIHLKTGNIIGVEALVRWVHPRLGVINPGKFIPVAEDTGFIIKIGEWALREACITNKYWQDEGYEHISVSLNFSPKQFFYPKAAEMIAAILQETGLSPNYVEIEINESTVMDELERTKNILNQIKETGVQISMDHFGTGYTSISHLKRLPITIVKIDQSFIKGIPNNPVDTGIAGGMIALARNLGLTVVAEGVETAEQLQFLAVQNCDIVQGYFLSYPVPAYSVSEQFKKLTDSAMI